MRSVFSFIQLCLSGLLISVNVLSQQEQGAILTGPGVSVLLVDTDHPAGKISEGVYGQFLEHINHSVVDGLYAEQIQGNGFEGKDFETHWKPFGENGSITVMAADFKNGEKSLQLKTKKNPAGIRQERIYLQEGFTYTGSVWVNRVEGSPRLTLRLKDNQSKLIKEISLKVAGQGWKEVPFSFYCTRTDTQSIMEIESRGAGTILLDFISMMREDVRRKGMLRPDLLGALNGLKPPFIRWTGGSFATD